MATADASIYSLIRPQQPMPDPVQDYGGMVQLKNLIRADRDEEATRAAYRASGGDPVKLRELLYGSGQFKAAMAAEKAGLETAKLKSGIEKDKLGVVSDSLKIHRDLLTDVTDPQTAARWVMSGFNDPNLNPLLQRAGSPQEVIARIPQDPKGFADWKMRNGLGIEKYQTALDAQRGREVTMRGQDQPKWDSERGVWVPVPGTAMAGGPGPRGAAGSTGSAIPVPGLPRRPEEIKADEAKARLLEGSKSRASVVISKVDEALKQTGFFTTGLTGTVAGFVPGTKAWDLDKTIDTIKANVGFKELQDMRTSSPTGGALGQIAVRELEFLQAALASLDKSQSEKQLRNNLKAVKTHFENWKKTVEQAGMQGTAGRKIAGGVLTDNGDGTFTYGGR